MASDDSAKRSTQPDLGQVVAGKYRITRVIGEGGMGVVFEALHERLNQRFALKVLRCEEGEKIDEYFGRFEREARAAAKLKGRNVARVTDVDALADGTPFLVMEYLEGTDLDSELARRGRLPIAEAVDYAIQACSGVAEAHSRGIIHRDLKPHNLYLTQEEEGGVVVKLLDFGISKVQDEAETSVTLTRSTLGTPLYMSPEQIRATRNADARSDIWSLGVILYELLTGKTPFDGENPGSVIAAITADDVPPPTLHRPELPPGLENAVMRALRKKPDERFQSAQAFAEALTPFSDTSSWVPPPRVSGVDFKVVIPDSPTLSFVDSRESVLTAPASAEPAAERGRRSSWPLIALAGLAMLAGLVFLLTRPPVTAEETGSAAAASEPTAGRPVSVQLETAARLAVTPATSASSAVSSRPSPSSPSASKSVPTKPKAPPQAKPRAAAPVPEPKLKPPAEPKPAAEPKPEPKPAPADNPVHL